MYRANAGGGFSANGDTWDPLTDYLVAGGDSTSSHGQPSTIHSSVPSGTPDQIWETERWDDSDGDEMQYEFDVPAGQQVEVRLYFYDGYSGTSAVGDRVFDVSIDGQTVLDDFDIIETYGDDTGAMASFTVTSDGTIDVDFGHVTENPQINAIEIVSAESQPAELGASPSSVDFGTVVTENSQTETVTLTNLGNASNGSHPDISVESVSISGSDDGQFSHDFTGSDTLAPGESMDVQVTYSPDEAQAHAATMEVTHNGSNSPVTVDLSGEGSSDVPVGFSKSTLQGFSAGNPTAIDFGPDGRVYVANQGGTVYALEVERNGSDDYQVVHEEEIHAIKDIPNHDDLGNHQTGEGTRQITGLTVGGTAEQPVVYVASSDPEIRVGQDTDATDTNSGAISRLTLDWNSDGSLANVDHDVMVLGLPRSEENHATNGLDLTADGDTLYVAQGGHTNKGAPGDNFGHTPEYALSAAVLKVDLAQIESDYAEKNLQSYDGNYPDLTFYYAIPTVQNDDATDGDDLPFGGDDGLNQAVMVADGPVQVYSPGYRNPYDLVHAESGQLYVIDNGPNGGWGGQPADSSGNIVDSACTNHPNEDGSYGTGDQLHLATEGSYGGHANPIRANPDDAGLYDADGNQYHDFDSSDSPVPFSMANPIECDYQDPSEDNSIGPTFGWTGGITEYTASNFDGEMKSDLLVVENANSIKRVQLNATGEGVTEVTSPFNTPGALGITAQDDDEIFPGTIWTANHGDNDVTVFEPDDYDGSGGDQCTGDYDEALDEDGDGYDNADEIDAGSDPCSAASTPPDFDDDGTSNVNDPDDDNDGIDDTQDSFAVDANNGLDTNLPATYDFAPNSHPGTILGLGFTGVMMNGADYQSLYDPGEVTAGGAANVLTVESVGQGDAHASTNTQEHAYQVGVNADEAFTVETTVNGLPDDAEPHQSQGIFLGTGDQDNYVKFTATGFSTGDDSGVQLAKEEGGSFTDVANPPAPTAGNTTTLSMTVYPSNGTVAAYYAMNGGEEQFVGETTVPTSWFDTADGNGTAVGVIATSNNADSTFDATWQYLYVQPVEEQVNQPPTADAGADQTVDEGTTVQLDASGSDDPDGDKLGYTWTQTAGTSVSLSANDAVDPTFTAPEVDGDETLTFQVSVSDGVESDTDTVNVTVQDTDTDTKSLEEAVASADDSGDDAKIEFTEIQMAINWWQTDAEVPETGGETINLTEMQELINLWQTDATIGDGNQAPTASLTITPENPTVGEQVTLDASGSTDPDGDSLDYTWTIDGQEHTDLDGETVKHTFETTGEHTVEVTVEDSAGNVDTASETITVSETGAANGSAEILVTPNSGIESSTYSSGSFQVANTGEENITSLTIDLRTTSLPDMVWDPDGTAGDQAAKGLVIDSESGDGVGVVSAADDDVFSQPHNGVNGSDGYDVLTIEFADFEPGEAVTFSADNDPTSIKGATISSQEAGPVSGLELARMTVTVEYADGSAQTTQTVGDGSSGGAEAVADQSVPAAPNLDVQGVTLDSTVLDDHHSAATVDEASQTVTVSGPPGATVTLVQVEGELELSNVPDYDGSPGYEIEAYEANKAENVAYYTDTVGSDGTVDVPVALTNSTDKGGFNYFVAAVEDDDGAGMASNVVVLKLEESTSQPGDGSVAVNAGGSEYTTGEGVTYSGDQSGFSGHSQFSTTDAIAGTNDDPLYQTEQYGGAPDEPSMWWNASMPNGDYVVTLHFAEIYQESAGERVFDVDIEGTTVLDDYDIYADVGHDTAVTKTETVTVSDGELNVEFDASVDNAKISAITVENASDDSGGTTAGSAEVTVNENGGIDASTYGGGSFQVANTGDQEITGVSFDLSSGTFTDVVFDPDGTAGDSGAKGFTVDSGVGGTTSGTFAQPHNGVDGDDGYDVLDVSFTDFQPGETLGFSVDIDPTSIKGGGSTGAAGSVSGLELSRATVTVEYADGSTQTTQLFGDGGDGGSQATAKDDPATAPTLGVDGVSLDGSALDSQHSAATVDSASQTITVSGPPGATVELLHVEGQLELFDTAGYDIEEYEANTAENVDYHAVTLDSNGEATVPVTLTNTSTSDAEGGFNYFVATVEDGDGDTGQVSNAVILKLEESSGDSSSQQTLHRANAGESTTLSATDDGPDWIGVTGTDSPYLASADASDGGNYCGGDHVTPDSTVPSSTPDAVFDCERYGNMTWEFSVDSGQDVEVRLYLSNQFPGASEPGDRQFNVSIEGQQVLTNYDPVADVGHANGTMKSFTVTDDGDGVVTVTFEQGAAENPQVNAIEILEAGDSS